MTETDSLAVILKQLDDGDESAANEIYSRFAFRLIGLARKRLDERLKQKVDPEDIVQSVFRSFFVRHAKGEFRFANWESMWGILAKMTLRKCGRNAETLLAACRDIRREISLSAKLPAGPVAWDALTRDPTVEEIAVFNETVAELFARLDRLQQQILEMKLKNYLNHEIADELNNVSERKVYRILHKIRQSLIEMGNGKAVDE